MWEKFKESKFAKKCKSFSKSRGALVLTLCLVLSVAVIVSVSIATNRAKQNELPIDTEGTEKPENNKPDKDVGISDGTVDAPVHNDETESMPVSAEPEEFELALPVDGIISKGHDSTIQVWSQTMSDYRVHLGLDIASDIGAPVYASADGKIEKIWDDALMGRCVAISHEGDIYTFYKNLDPVLSEGIAEDSTIKCGQQIGKVGESAIAELADEPHLHIEMTVNGLAVDPADYLSDKAKETLSKDENYESGAVMEEITE